MSSPRQYKTKQKELILDCIRLHQLFYHYQRRNRSLRARHEKVGTATIYRNLDRLEEEGIITRCVIEGIDGVCYRYLQNSPENVYFFLKCEQCGDLSPIDCGELQHLYEHVIEHHHVRINPAKTVLYGLCEKCLKDAEA